MWKFKNVGLIFYLSFLCLLCFRCKNPNEEIIINNLVQDKSEGKIILDSFRKLNNIPVDYDEDFFPTFKSHTKSSGATIVDSMQSPNRSILFFGKKDKWFEFSSKEFTDDYKIWGKINSDFVKGKIQLSDFENLNSPILKVWVDTTQIINNERVYIAMLKGDSYAVYIINNSNLWYITNMDPEFPMLMQAKDRNGDWRYIEYKINSKIDSGLLYFLGPKSYFVTSARKYGGNFNTKFRLIFKQKDKFVYSNEFSGSINESQFEIPHLPKTNDFGKKNYKIFLE